MLRCLTEKLLKTPEITEKLAHHAPVAGGYIIVPFIEETSGVWGEEALPLTKRIRATLCICMRCDEYQ